MTSVARIVKELIFGPEPIGAADAVTLARAQVRLLSGAPGGGTPHFGETGTPALTWSGWTATPQEFRGNVQMGKGTAVVETYPALPSAAPPTAVPGWLAQMESMSNQGMP